MTTSTSPDVIEHVIGPAGELNLRLHAGDVSLRGVEGGTVRIRDVDGNDLAERFTVEAADGRLSLHPRGRFLIDFGFGLAGFGRAVQLSVEVPAGARIHLDTASASIHGTGLRGEQRYRTASGSIDLDAAAGEIAIDAVSGSVDLRVDGDVGLSGRAVSGDVTVRGGRLRSLALSLTSGDVELESDIAGPGPYGVQTVSGDVSVTSGQGLRVEARTITGDVSSDLGHRSESVRGQHVLTIGDGRTPFSFKSISGDLRVGPAGAARSRAGQASPVTPAVEPETGPDPASQDRSAERLAILRELEEGTIDIEAASARLAELEDAG